MNETQNNLKLIWNHDFLFLYYKCFYECKKNGEAKDEEISTRNNSKKTKFKGTFVVGYPVHSSSLRILRFKGL